MTVPLKQYAYYILVFARFYYNKIQFMETEVSSMPNYYLAKSQQEEIQCAYPQR